MVFKKKEVKEVVEKSNCNSTFEEYLQYHENITTEESPLGQFKDEVCSNHEEIPFIDENGGVDFEGYDSSLIVSSEIDQKYLDSFYHNKGMQKCFKKKDGIVKKLRFEEDTPEYDNLRSDFGWWLGKKDSRRKSYEQMIPLNHSISRSSFENGSEEEVNDRSTRTSNCSICLKILKYFFLLLLFLIPLFLFALAFFGFGLCDIKPTIPHTLYLIGFIIFLSFVLSILLSLDWSPSIAIFLTILLIIVGIILGGLVIFVTYWFSDFYYLLQQQPPHCPTLYCSDRSVFAYVVGILFSCHEKDKIIDKKVIYDEVYRPHTQITPIAQCCQVIFCIIIIIIGWDHIKHFCVGTDDKDSVKLEELLKKQYEEIHK